MEWIFAVGSALWLGILTSISPCPMATNIAAISYVSRNVESSSKVFLTGILYASGRTLVYTILGMLLIMSLLSAPIVSHILQKYMNMVLGPILIIVGMFLLELLTISFKGKDQSEKLSKITEKLGIWGGMFLGVVFALSFCPVSAALFFGSLIPLGIKFQSFIIFPAVYGFATGLPVLIFAGIIAFGAQKIGNIYNKITVIELWFRKITGTIFIVVGIYYSLKYIFGIDI